AEADHCYSLITRSHLINGRGLGGGRFLAWVRRDEAEYPSRPIGTTKEQRHRSQKATPSAGQEHFAASGRVARSLSRTCGTGMRVTRASPATTNCSCAAPPIYEMASNYLSQSFSPFAQLCLTKSASI